jgi:two-component system invasion response regulator UvrY
VKILLTDDHQIVRDGLKQILQQIPDIEWIEEAKNGKETIHLAAQKEFDIIILDISLPDISGLEVLRTIKENHREIRILMLSMYSQAQYAVRAFKMGASGYLNKDSASDELIAAVKKIAKGGKYVTSSLAEELADHLNDNYSGQPHEKLSEREFEIMLKLATGKSLREISTELFISEKTVSTYRTRLLGKMGMKKNAEITQYCLQNGLML